MSLNIDWLNAITFKTIHNKTVEDLVFRSAVFLKFLRRNRFAPYEGGVSIDAAFLYKAMNGGAYDTGEPLNTDVVEPVAGQTFTPRKYYAAVAEYMENLAINRGPAAVFNTLRLKHEAAVNTINNQVNVGLYLHGQNISGDVRTKHVNGLEEALNDGVTQSWRGNIFTSYGGQTRNDGNVGAGYNSVPYFCGNNVTGAAGQITYDKVLDAYLRACQGDRKPDVGLGNKAVWGFLLKRIQPQQTFQFTPQLGTSAQWGATAIKFMTMDLMIDQYAPSASAQFGENDSQIGNWQTASSVTISGTPATGSNRPPSGTFVPGEVLFLLNSETFKFHLSTHPYFKFGFTGFMPKDNNTKFVGRIHAMGTMTCDAPWLSTVMDGINN